MKRKALRPKRNGRKDAASMAAQRNSDAEQIRALRAKSNVAIARHDVPGIIALLDDDFQITVGNGGMLQGRAETGAAFLQQFQELGDVLYVRTIESVEVSSSDPLAAEIGTWVGTWTIPRGSLRTGGRYAASWRKQAGVWAIRAELFVTLFCEETDLLTA